MTSTQFLRREMVDEINRVEYCQVKMIRRQSEEQTT
jgi:hypothetical protein